MAVFFLSRRLILKTGSIFAMETKTVMKLFISVALWCLLLILCWPIALLLLFMFPIIWLILLPFRIVGLTLELVFKVVGAILMFPFKAFSR